MAEFKTGLKPSVVLDYLEQFFDEIQPYDFYRALFPVGTLQDKGNFMEGRYNAIAVELLPQEDTGVNAKRHIITDDLDELRVLLDSENFIIISPITYAGRSRQAENARFIYAIAIDLDGITESKYIKDLFYQIDNEVLPKPTYIVSSGTGLHLYYQLVKPIPCFKNIVKQLSELKKGLTKKIWNRYTTSLFDKPQIESLFQGFRLVGGITKYGSRTKCFEIGESVSIDYLNSFVDTPYKVIEYTYKTDLTLQQAASKYPEWYERRIVEGKPKGSWTCKKDLFYWWADRIASGAAVGHRYFCIMVLAIYAKKSGVSREELERVAFEFVEPFDKLTQDTANRFTREDILAALEMFNDNYITFPIDSIVNLTNIPIEKNKRNHRRQDLHLKLARASKAILKEAGEIKKEGRPSKEMIVCEWRKLHPNGKKIDCIKDTGLSKSTVYRHWNSTGE